ncbi:MAG: shikimate kinase [Eubacteriales bacterium]|nr:shikimate kinase [Eubacteriales bacterium]
MNILLFGVSNVGKSVTGELLASRLNYQFYDLDEEVKNKLGITLETFVSSGTLLERDLIRCSIINSLISIPSDKVIAVTPLTHIVPIRHLFSEKDVLAIELLDSAENIFDRLVFSDENDNIYKDDEYKNRHKNYYLNDIRKDLEWYGSVYSVIKHKFDMDGRDTAGVTEALIQKYHLNSRTGG